MKTVLNSLGILTTLSLLILSCQKEISYEGGNQQPSSGSLQANNTGGCLGSVVNGTYIKDTTLKSTNYVDVNVQVDTVGTYTITTDTVNGYYFKATGVFSSTGVQVVRLMGTGKPINAGTDVFTVSYDGTICDFSVTVTTGTGGSAVFTVNCPATVVNGTYTVGTPLAATNTAVLSINVTTLGTWSITSASLNGMVFSGSGTFTVLGNQNITLTGSGTPAAAGTFNVSIVVNGVTCTFPVVCVSVPDYFPRTANSNWSYEFDQVSSDSVLVQATANTHTALGNTYVIFRETSDMAQGWDSSGYYRRAGGSYFEWIDIGTSVGLDNELWIEYTFLKDDVPAGSSWFSPEFTGTFNGTTVTARLKYAILQKDVNAVSSGTTYNNTIIVEERLEQNLGGTWIDLTTQPGGISLRYYYSRNIGLIKIEIYDLGTTLSGQLEMRRYTVF